MPIRPDEMARYPGGSIRSREWGAIRERIRARADNRCEVCGVANHAVGGRDPLGRFFPAIPLNHDGLYVRWPDAGTGAWCCDGRDVVRLRIIRIVCTVAHLNHRPEDCRDENLRFMCQRCHLRYDNQRRRAERRGTADLFA